MPKKLYASDADRQRAYRVRVAAKRVQAEQLLALVSVCRDQFAFYERQHVEKGTPDSLKKAEVNRSFKERCERALAAAQS